MKFSVPPTRSGCKRGAQGGAETAQGFRTASDPGPMLALQS